MKIQIEIEKGIVSVRLKEKKEIIDSLIFPEDRSLAEKLLPAVDSLLRKNKLAAGDIDKMELKADIHDSFTTYRIARAVVDTFNMAAHF